MQAIILAGGEGTRLKCLYPETPKGLVELNGKPFLEWQILWLRSGGVHDVHLAAGCMASQIEKWADGDPIEDVHITVSTEPAPLGTGGALKYVESFIKADPFLVLNGDSIIPSLDIGAMGEQHEESHSTVTLVVTRMEDGSRFGAITLDDDNRITCFEEKRDRKDVLVNGGVYLINREALAIIPGAEEPVSIERDVFPSLVASGAVSGFRCEPPLLDMGTPEGLEAMRAHLVRCPIL